MSGGINFGEISKTSLFSSQVGKISEGHAFENLYKIKLTPLSEQLSRSHDDLSSINDASLGRAAEFGQDSSSYGKNSLSDLEDFHDQHDLLGKVRSRAKRRTYADLGSIKKKNLEGKCLLSSSNLNNYTNVKKLLTNGVSANFADSRGRTALHFASCKGNAQIAQLLIDYGANPNQKDQIGNTPLHLAACTKHIQMVTLLLKAGANLTSMDNNGRTPWSLAISQLTLLQNSAYNDSTNLKHQTKEIIEMMQVYLRKQGHTEQSDMIGSFKHRLDLHMTKEDVDQDLIELLSSINGLNLD